MSNHKKAPTSPTPPNALQNAADSIPSTSRSALYQAISRTTRRTSYISGCRRLRTRSVARGGIKCLFTVRHPLFLCEDDSPTRLIASQLANELEYFSSNYPNHLVVYTGTSAATFSTQHGSRQHPEPLTRPVFESVAAPSNTTLAQGGILKRYQLLTPGLITSLLIVFFVLLPILSFGFRALASIQSPLETETPNKFSADEKKRQ
ncbi:hypothetical protein C0993_009877 [Termitomyces sp. T159_Od127]|nr:hypothetical protein C0993_009877 [Termitomyces sp. T159_Od127]